MPMHIEITDRPSGESDQAQVARYQNNYRLEPNNAFRCEMVEKLLETIVTENLENYCYDSRESAKVCSSTAAEIRRKIQELNFDRYKIIVMVTITEKASQSLEAAMGFLWDTQRDNYVTYTFEGRTFFAYCCAFALYYE